MSDTAYWLVARVVHARAGGRLRARACVVPVNAAGWLVAKVKEICHCLEQQILRDKTQYFETLESSHMICILPAAAAERENVRQIVARMARLYQPCLLVIVYYNILTSTCTMISVCIWWWTPQHLHKYIFLIYYVPIIWNVLTHAYNIPKYDLFFLFVF